MNGVVLSLFDHTGNMVRPWAEAGYECWCLDIQNGMTRKLTPNILYIAADLLKWQLPVSRRFAIAFAFPPCTHLAASGARWWRGKGLSALSESIALVARAAEICDATGAPWMIENPNGALSTHWRKPDASFDPCDYGGYLTPPRRCVHETHESVDREWIYRADSEAGISNRGESYALSTAVC